MPSKTTAPAGSLTTRQGRTARTLTPRQRRTGPSMTDDTRTPSLTAGVTLNAVAALVGGQETFTREQVAYLIALAYRSGMAASYEEDVAELHVSWQTRAERQRVYERRVAQRMKEMEAGAAREASRRRSVVSMPAGPWPPVVKPGTGRNSDRRRAQSPAPDGSRSSGGEAA